jgi:hypothetical protein
MPKWNNNAQALTPIYRARPYAEEATTPKPATAAKPRSWRVAPAAKHLAIPKHPTRDSRSGGGCSVEVER